MQQCHTVIYYKVYLVRNTYFMQCIVDGMHSKIVILILRKKILVSSKKLLETSKIILVSIVRILF